MRNEYLTHTEDEDIAQPLFHNALFVVHYLCKHSLPPNFSNNISTSNLCWYC